MERKPRFVCTVREEDVYRAVLKEVGRRLSAREIAQFPGMVSAWLARNPEYPASAHQRVRGASHAALLMLIKQIEDEEEHEELLKRVMEAFPAMSRDEAEEHLRLNGA